MVKMLYILTAFMPNGSYPIGFYNVKDECTTLADMAVVTSRRNRPSVTVMCVPQRVRYAERKNQRLP